jgi:hypothetical protein
MFWIPETTIFFWKFNKIILELADYILLTMKYVYAALDKSLRRELQKSEKLTENL